MLTFFISTIIMEVALLADLITETKKQPDDLVNERVRFKEVLVIDQKR